MKALVVIAHYFKPTPGAIHSSLQESQREARRASLKQALFSWRANFSESAVINIEHKRYETHPVKCRQLDLAILVNGDNHLLDPDLLRRFGVRQINVETDNPRLLPFAAHRVMQREKHQHDWFVYSEDDLVMHDCFFFQKLEAFQAAFGMRRVLQPHRYELNPNGLRFKTYIDGALRKGFIQPFLDQVPESQQVLCHDAAGGELKYVRARNPHSGFFALSAAQVEEWTKQKHFLDIDCSFVSPLESAATLAILKTFSIYKPDWPQAGYFEIQHLDNKFSNMRLPLMGADLASPH